MKDLKIGETVKVYGYDNDGTLREGEKAQVTSIQDPVYKVVGLTDAKGRFVKAKKQ